MEKLPSERGQTINDSDTGQNENARGGRQRQGAQRNGPEEQEGRRRAEQAREVADDGGRTGGEGVWRGDRGRGGRANTGRGGERSGVRGGRGGTNGRGGGGGGEGVQGRGPREEAVAWRGVVGGGTRGRNEGRGGWLARNGDPGTAERGRGRMGGRGGGHSLDRRGGGRADSTGDRRGRNGWRSPSECRGGAPQGPRLGYKALEELAQEAPSIVAISLSSHPALPGLLSESQLRQDLVELLCVVMSRAFKSRAERSTLQHLANIIKESEFFRTALLHYVGNMGTESNPQRRARYPQQLENILAILSKVFSTFPASSVKSVGLLLTLVRASTNTLRASGLDISAQVERSMETLQDQVQHLQERAREGTLRSDKDTYALLQAAGANPGEEEQQDFRSIPIYPTPEEFQQDTRPFLRPNLTSQRYTNTQLYLDTHFRLLREDFVRPLREGIQELLDAQKDVGRSDKPLRMRPFNDIYIYFNTKVIAPNCTRNGLAYIVHFDKKPLKFVRWQNSKRLLYGSLVLLSCDNFASFLFATVSDRDPAELQKGQVQLTFTQESRVRLARIQHDQKFLMVESTAYFEAYHYVLEGLQEQEEDDLPFQRYIVECNTDVQPPAYLGGRAEYDLASIAEPKCVVRPFHALDDAAWPRMEELGLDESQMRALQLALTKELAIIQGPPGTGKTYVGLKIAQALLMNKDLWIDELDRAPMLVVCYTNHALDQFLEGIHSFLETGIVRVGGRSNSEILKPFNLRELSRSHNYRVTPRNQLRLPQRSLQSAYDQIYKELCEEEQRMQSKSMELQCTWKGVLRENILTRFISDRHWTSLHQPMQHDFDVYNEWQKKKPSVMMEWLGLGSTVSQQRETEDANAPEEDDSSDSEVEDLIEIAEEADLIQAERMIEDGSRGEGGGRKKGGAEGSIRAVEEHMLAMTLDADVKPAEQSADGFQMQKNQKKKMKRKVKNELKKSSAMTEAEEGYVYSVWTLSLPDRWQLYRLWVGRYRDELRTKILQCEDAYQNAVDRLADVKQREDLCVLQEATVIGMTTTGAAKFRTLLQEVQPRLVIVEEAAEVLEAHTITTLSKVCQHLILIGDHQQLRPSPNVYDLAKNFNLEMSMFERLLKVGLPYVRLNYQHRMRPEIACLLTPHIYSELQNHPSVLDFDNIKGLITNLFFVEHNHLEEQIKDGRSHQNKHEALFVVALCRYLLLQGYKPQQITILTTYTGQLYCLRGLMPASEFSGVKVHVVDKYQGEENDIVLLSLVRSNVQGKVGFLNIPNRVCVALSRAKKGLYCIGNSAILGHVKLWSNIFHTLREKNQVGQALTLCCQNHPDRLVEAFCADDFKKAPEGGCQEPCQFRLDCGHVCTRACHPYDAEHKEFKCTKTCDKVLCDLGHKCTLVCHKTCPKQCPVMLPKVIPRCQHTQMVPCHQDPQTFSCREPCQKTLPCGHPCDSLCGGPCTRRCIALVTLALKCGHSQRGACFYQTGTEEPECRTPCAHRLKCGHGCAGTCGRCHQGRFHSPCVRQCERLLICSHGCREPCTGDCPPCQRPCENFCIHSKCMKPCGQPCAPCREPCAWQCPHQTCSKLCHEPCDRPPCTQPCARTLACSHPCIGLCGDKCPSKCRVCDREEVTEIFFGTEDEPDARFIQLEDCGHIIEFTAMDRYVGEGDAEEAIKLKECPKCRAPIRKNLRYGSHINRSLASIEMVKAKINGNQADIEEQRSALEQQWEKNLDFDLNFQYDKRTYKEISENLKKKHLTANDLRILEHRMDFLVRVEKLRQFDRSHYYGCDSECDFGFTKSMATFEDWINNPYLRFTEQQVFDLERQMARLTCLCQLLAHVRSADRRQSEDIKPQQDALRSILEKSGQFTAEDELLAKQTLKELDDKVPLKGLRISEDERKMIVSAMNMRPGHWHKCPNGHIYIITDCGGAMERRKCPDCDATIGGSNHRLDEGNQVASEMDGATHPAWSEANNILNFDDL
ncbi:NFX1-type zinc finger-containing protein 1 [Betta splendens]|uniref:NFX1-type zinc finger-containing protein 1 n=1 Tax=Betta splendens TaxID=158456 RepID=A0A6P7MJ82_BETSP|nr:NFX1-type zinc finger-containing protein 1 [Betta splendens]